MSTDPPSDPDISGPDSPDPDATVAEALRLSPVIDGHNDWAWESRKAGYSVDGLENAPAFHTDIRRLRAGGVGAQFWSVWVEDDDSGAMAVQQTLEQIDWVHRLVARYPDDFVIARSAADIEAAQTENRIASLLGAEGGHQLNDSPAVLRMLAELGVRYLTLTHNRTSPWADAALGEQTHGGLTARGVRYIAELERLGVLVDLSHVAATTMHATLDVATAPVIFSHSSCRAIGSHLRNVPDDVLRRIPTNGGVVMITFVPQFLSDGFDAWFEGDKTGPAPKVGLSDVADHIEHARELAGIDGVGLGGDFDGTVYFPDGIDGVDAYPAILRELAVRGWAAPDLAKLAGGNILRVLRATDDAFSGRRRETDLVL